MRAPACDRGRYIVFSAAHSNQDWTLSMRAFSTRASLVLSASALILFIAAPLGAEQKPGEWRYYGGDLGSRKYSPLDQINKDNAPKLKIAWTWESPDLPLQKDDRKLSSFAFEIT